MARNLKAKKHGDTTDTPKGWPHGKSYPDAKKRQAMASHQQCFVCEEKGHAWPYSPALQSCQAYTSDLAFTFCTTWSEEVLEVSALCR